MSLCEPIRKQIEEEEDYLIGEFPSVLTRDRISRIKDIAIYNLHRPAWCDGDCDTLITLWKSLYDCESKALKELKSCVP